MRRLLLLAGLCMTLALVLSAPAMAQSASAPSGEPLPASGECPSGTQPFSPSGTGDDTQCITDAQLGNYFRAIGEGGATRPATSSPDATPSTSPDATATAESSATAEPEASASPLPETGGPAASAMALPMLVLLVAGGIFAARLARR